MHASAFGFFFGGGFGGLEPQVLVERQAQAADAPTCRKFRRFSGEPAQRVSKCIGGLLFGVGVREFWRAGCQRVSVIGEARSRPGGGRQRQAGSENDVAASFSQVEDSRAVGSSQFNPLPVRNPQTGYAVHRCATAVPSPRARLGEFLALSAGVYPSPPAAYPPAFRQPRNSLMRSALPLLSCSFFLPRRLAADPVDYRKDIKPVLQERCYACHGALAQKAKLRVDSGANLLKARRDRARQAGRERADRSRVVRGRRDSGCRPRATRSSRSRSRSSRRGSSRARRCPPTTRRNPTRATTGRSARPSGPPFRNTESRIDTESDRRASSPRSGQRRD